MTPLRGLLHLGVVWPPTLPLHVGICLLFSHIKELKELGFLTPRMELPHIARVIRSAILVHIKPTASLSYCFSLLQNIHSSIDLIAVRYRVPNTTYLQHGDEIHKPWPKQPQKAWHQ
jgi:hypothetical protein